MITEKQPPENLTGFGVIGYGEHLKKYGSAQAYIDAPRNSDMNLVK